jgi:response regulator RpfG family c-di-GMP phosphodiesterase
MHSQCKFIIFFKHFMHDQELEKFILRQQSSSNNFSTQIIQNKVISLKEGKQFGCTKHHGQQFNSWFKVDMMFFDMNLSNLFTS